VEHTEPIRVQFVDVGF